MTERMNDEPQFKMGELNGRKVRIIPAEQAPIEPTPEVAAPAVLFSHDASRDFITPALRTVEIIEAELAEVTELERELIALYGESPNQLAVKIQHMRSELENAKAVRALVTKKASILEQSDNELIEIDNKAEALKRELKAVEEERVRIKEESDKKRADELARVDRLNAAREKYLNDTVAPVAERPRVTLLPSAEYDDQPTTVFDGPLVTEPTVAPHVVEEASAPVQEPKLPEPISDNADEVPFARPTASFIGEDINPLDGQKFAERGRLRKTAEKIGALPRRTQVMGGLAVVTAIAAFIGTPLTVNHFTHNGTSVAQEQVDADNQKLAAEILGACSNENSFDNVLLSQSYDATSGIVWTAKDGETQADGTVHKVGPNEARETSMMKIKEGKIDVTMCDDDKAPAVTIDGTTIKLNLDNATMLANVNDGSTKYKQPGLDNAEPATDGSMTSEDITELRLNSRDTELLAIAQKQTLGKISKALETDASLTQSTAEKQAKDNAEAFVKKQLEALGNTGDYDIKVTGEAKEFKAVTPVKSETSKKVSIDKVDVTITK